ncbi:MAG: LysR family transcriptional regulator [Phycisphaerales bacterium]|jgi:DNA-binding transcriptional LysR family regulator
MHIESLKVFCDLAELKSFSKTAERHQVSQSAISQQLAQMELLHNCQLINRKKRPLELTAPGQLFYQMSREIVDKYEDFKGEMNALKSVGGTRLNVAAIFSIGMHSLPRYVKKFMVRYPDVHVHLEYLSAQRIYELVLGGEVDIGLVAIPKRDKRLDVYDFEMEPLVLVCSPRHPLAKQTQVDITQLQFERFIGFEAEIPTRAWIDNILQRYNVSVQLVMEFDNIETVKRAVEINTGISILSKTAVVQEVADGTLKAIEFSNEKFVRPTGIITRKNKIQTRAGRYFLKLLTSGE